MAQSITDVAAYILTRTGTITTMKLHKLAYYAQAAHIVAHGGAPLFPEDFYAWRGQGTPCDGPYAAPYET